MRQQTSPHTKDEKFNLAAVLLAGPRRRVPAVLRLNDGFSNDSAVFDLFVRLPRSVARNNGLVSADGIRRATIMVRGAEAQRLLANLQCYLPGVPARSPHFHPHVSSILMSMLAASEVRRPSRDNLPEFTSSFAEAAIHTATPCASSAFLRSTATSKKCLCMLGHRVVTKQGIESDSESDGDLPLNRIVDPRVWGGNLAATEEVAALLRRCSQHPMLQDQELSLHLPRLGRIARTFGTKIGGPFPKALQGLLRTPPSSKLRRPAAPRSAAAAAPARARARARAAMASDLAPSSCDESDGGADAAARARARARGSGGPRARGAVKTKRRAPASDEDEDEDEDEELEEPADTSRRGGRGGERRGGGIGVRGAAAQAPAPPRRR